MKLAAFLALSALLAAVAPAARGEDTVYLRRIGSELEGRFEVLTHRPFSSSPDVIDVPVRDVSGWEEYAEGMRSGGTVYVVRTSPSSLPDRYAVRALSPGISYLRSIGGGGSFPMLPPKRVPVLKGLATPGPFIAKVSRPASSSAPSVSGPTKGQPESTPTPRSNRPFGWPPYQNPLERKAYR